METQFKNIFFSEWVFKKNILCTFLQEPVAGGVSGSSRERRLPLGTPGVAGLRLARNGEEKRT